MQPSALREARPFLIVLGVCAAVTICWIPPLAGLFILAFAYVLYFFRDPDRFPPADPDLLVAPADGKVVEVTEIEENEFINQRMLRIGIFLSIFDVHVNRSPMEGKIIHSEAKRGEYLDARDPASSIRNVRRSWLIQGPVHAVVVRQITGAIARRIVPWSKVGDQLERGQKFGMIRFGSRTELYLPLETPILVKVGDKVKGGETPVARLKP